MDDTELGFTQSIYAKYAKNYTGPTGRFAMRESILRIALMEFSRCENSPLTGYRRSFDHLNSTSVITDNDEALLCNAFVEFELCSNSDLTCDSRSFAFGEVRNTTGTNPTDYTYTGQRYEEEVGLSYYVARWFDPVLGHFIQADSLIPQPGNAGDWDRYAYVLWNPVRYNDPLGQEYNNPTDQDPLIDGDVYADSYIQMVMLANESKKNSWYFNDKVINEILLMFTGAISNPILFDGSPEEPVDNPYVPVIVTGGVGMVQSEPIPDPFGILLNIGEYFGNVMSIQRRDENKDLYIWILFSYTKYTGALDVRKVLIWNDSNVDVRVNTINTNIYNATLSPGGSAIFDYPGGTYQWINQGAAILPDKDEVITSLRVDLSYQYTINGYNSWLPIIFTGNLTWGDCEPSIMNTDFMHPWD
ncbi:MAG: RHS repeat-associated core domain-containing protein [Anaerolineae bacterium]|nr:RHS repeat-associated core domain-containing protein [Anaerolineae bacterium]